MARLKDIAKLCIDGDWIESKDQSDSGIRLIQTGNIGIGEYLDKTSRAKYISEETFTALKCTEVFPYDVLISRLPDPLGRGCVVPKGIGKAITAVDCTIIRPDETRCLSKYLVYYTESKAYADQIEKFTAGSTRARISRKNLESIDIPTIPIEEQKKIVAIFDLIDALISLRKKQLQKLDDLVKSRFVEIFGDPETNPKGWKKGPLSQEIIAANNGMARRGNDENGNIVMRLVELQDGYIDYSNPNRIALTKDEKKRYLLKSKDFLFARVNGNPENVGRCAVFTDIGEPVYHNDHIIRVHFNEATIEGAFASALFNSEYGKRQLKKQIKTSAGQYTVSQDGIGAIITILPPIELQKAFAAFVSQVDKSKLTVQQGLAKLELLKQSLMQKYFG